MLVKNKSNRGVGASLGTFILVSSSHGSSQQAPVFGKICVSSGTAEDIDNLLFWESCEKSIFNFCLFVCGGFFFVCVLCVCLVGGGVCVSFW